MDANIKRRWVAALRSGEYEQGRGYLRTVKNEYCCLGVLCDLSGVGGWSRSEIGEYEYMGMQTLMPGSVSMWAGGLDETFEDVLMEMNDGVGGIPAQDFNAIADYIEENL